MFRMMRAVPRMASLRHATIKSQTVKSVNHKVSMVTTQPLSVLSARKYSDNLQQKTQDDLELSYIEYFNRPDLDSWQIRKAMADLLADVVPQSEVVAAALRACRRVDDFSLTARFLEVVKIKCGHQKGDAWPDLLEQLQPTFVELGIPTAAQL